VGQAHELAGQGNINRKSRKRLESLGQKGFLINDTGRIG
jgi:hypothetical protein